MLIIFNGKSANIILKKQDGIKNKPCKKEYFRNVANNLNSELTSLIPLLLAL